MTAKSSRVTGAQAAMRAVVAGVTLFGLMPQAGWADPLAFPPPPATAIAAAAAFDSRVAAVIATNACGREDDYLAYRTAMALGDFDHEGEDLISVLLAKAAYVRAHSATVAVIACPGATVRPRARAADGNFADATLQDFANADRLARAKGPTACAREVRETKRLHQPNALTDAQKADLNVRDQFDELAVDLLVTPDCMVRQINEAVMAMQKTTQLGSSDLRCLEHLAPSKGEFDITVRALVRLLYFAGPAGRDPGLLAPPTIDHMYRDLLAARGPPSDDSYSLLAGCGEPAGDELGTPEETADRHAWYNELADDIGDFFGWLLATFFRIVGSALSVAGGLAAAPFMLAAGYDPTPLIIPHADIRVRETENHRLSIETSRFLTNADIIARLDAEGYDHVGDVRDDQAQVRDWLMHRLQDIAAHDFQEYNARPYTRYSLNAVLNLRDFAAVHDDPQLATAAGIVLDLSEAKFAATANRGRRTSPFRRRSENDGYGTDPSHAGPAGLYNVISGGDHEVARAMLLAGQTQLLGGGPSRDAISQMVDAAISSYRLPQPVLTAAVERPAASQTVRHTGVERSIQSPAFTISAGGIPTGPTATVLGFSDPIDHGVAMPTTIMPTLAGWMITDLFRFDGVGAQNERSPNTCVAGQGAAGIGWGFACGVAPQIPALYAACTSVSTTLSDDHVFASSAVCFPGPGPHFYLAARLTDCTGSLCPAGLRYGLMEITEATPPPAGADGKPVPDPAFVRFQTERNAALAAASVDVDGHGAYITASGHRVDFSVAGGAAGLGDPLALTQIGPRMGAVDGAPPPAWTTAGDLLSADGQGRATINGAGGPVTIDFSDWSNPLRTP